MRTCIFLVLLVFPMVAAAPSAWTLDIQDAEAGLNAVPQVTLAPSVGPPGGSVAVPVHFTGRKDQPLHSLVLELRAPESLTFTKAEIGGLGIALGLEAKTTVTRKDSERLLHVILTVPKHERTRVSLPDGPVAQLMFTLAKSLKPETVIPLKLKASGVSAANGVPVSTKDGHIVVANPTVISCFFYMH